MYILKTTQQSYKLQKRYNCINNISRKLEKHKVIRM